jgi:hypothetical protein
MEKTCKFYTVLYSCERCRALREIAVRARSENETVENWVLHACKPRILEDHEDVSPECDEDNPHAWLPVRNSNKDMIGRAVLQ